MNSQSANIWARLISPNRTINFKKEIIKYFEEEDQKEAAQNFLLLLSGGETSCEIANFFYQKYLANLSQEDHIKGCPLYSAPLEISSCACDTIKILINPGIQKLVALLNKEGFETIDSGDGETHDFGCDRDYPYVSIITERPILTEETIRLKFLMKDHGVKLYPINTEGLPCIQATYDPMDMTAIIDLQNVTDKDLKNEVKDGNFKSSQ